MKSSRSTPRSRVRWHGTCNLSPAVEERFGEVDVCFTERLWSIKEDSMRRTSLAVVVAVAAIMAFSLLLVPLVGATSGAAPLLQTTATAVGTEAATAAATTAATAAATTAATAAATTAATAAATTAATAAATAATTAGTATPTRAPSTLPNTGGDTGSSALLLGAAALVLIGVAAALLMGRRRDTTV
jgi:LPXTG-motif cell wall-anchored protein